MAVDLLLALVHLTLILYLVISSDEEIEGKTLTWSHMVLCGLFVFKFFYSLMLVRLVLTGDDGRIN